MGKKSQFSPHKLFVLVWVSLLLVWSQLCSQVSLNLNPSGYGYTFSSSSGTYTPLTGGTVFQSGATLNTDANSAGIALPWVFYYNGIPESTIFINNNGYITFNIAQTTASNTLPLSTTTTSGYDGAIAGLANNLVAAATGTPEISYGTNATGDFVIQYQDLAVNTYTSTRITFQILLKADKKTIQIIYGPNNTGQASVSGSQVGIRGTCDEDWNNRSLASGGNWNTSGGAAGTLNSNTMTWTAASTLPVSGLTFQWSPTTYVPTYRPNAIGTTEEFDTWVNGAGPNNIPSIYWGTNGYGNASWQVDNCPSTTTTTGWGSGTLGVYTPVDYASSATGHSARFHAYNANSPQVGYLDYYVDLSGCGTDNRRVSFYTRYASGTANLQVYLSTDGGATFTLQTMSPAFSTGAAWVSRYVDLGSVTSTTCIIRFKATSDFGANDIGLDHVNISTTGGTPTTYTVTPSTGLICGTGSVTLDAAPVGGTGPYTYTWSPSTGLNTTSGATVIASPTTTTTYTVTGFDQGNCTTSTATATITASQTPKIFSVTATPSTICNGGTSVLNGIVSNNTTQTFAASTGATLASMTGATQVIGSSVDDAPTASPASIGFTFTFNGVDYTQYSVSPDGWILLGGATAVSDFSNTGNESTNIPKIFPYWDDLATGTTGNVQTLVQGTAPNRVFIVQWFVTIPRNTTGAANSTFQALLYESTGVIEFIYGTMGSGGMSASVGTTSNATTYNSITVSTNTNSTTTINDTNAGQPTSGTKYTFSPSSSGYTYAWTPSAGLVPDAISPTVTTPALTADQTYTLTATDANSCTFTKDVTVTVGAALGVTVNSLTRCSADPTTSTLTAVPTGGGSPYTYTWSPTTDLYTDAAGTVPYTGIPLSAPVIYTKATSTTTYVVTLNDNCGSSATANSLVTLNSSPTASAGSNSPVCIGSTLNLLGTTDIGTVFSWTGPNAFTSTDQNPSISSVSTLAAGNYVFTATAGTCSSSSTVNVVVNSGPALHTVVAVPNSICEGASSVLTVSPASLTYCQSTHATGCSGDNMTSITLNTLNNSTSACGLSGSTPPRYLYQTGPGAPTTTLSATGGSYTLTISFGTDNNQYFGAWIDYNQDGLLTASEFLGASTNAGSGGTTSISFTVPVGALNGLTRLRIVGGNDSAVTAGQACGASSSAWGETLDFDVTIIDGTVPYTYLWDDPMASTTSSTTVTPTATGANVYNVIVTASNGCFTSIPVTVTVNPLPTVTCGGPYGPYCLSDADVTLVGSPAGGTWTGPGITTSPTFSPAAAGVGTNHVLTYTYTDSNGCTNTCTTVIEVLALPTATISYAGSPFCPVGTAPVTQTGQIGGTYSATGGLVVSSTTGEIDLVASAGSSGTVTYTFSDGTCSNTATATVTVHPVTVITCGGPYGPLCTADAAITLTGSPLTGIWSGTGVTDNADGTASFDPLTAQPGTHTVTYTVVDGNSCTVTCTEAITVVASPTATIAYTGSPYCATGTATVTLTGTTGGTYSSTAGLVIDATTGDIDLAASTSGTYTVTYSFGASGCNGTTTTTVTINALPIVSAGGPYTTTLCNSVGASITLSGTPLPAAGETAVWTGSGITDNGNGTAIFSASGLAAGSYTLTYTFTDSNGCIANSTVAIEVINCGVADNGGTGIGDPCYCNNDATTLSDGTFWEVVFVWNDLNSNGVLEVGEDSPMGQIWTVSAQTGAIGVTAGTSTLSYGNIPTSPTTFSGVNGYFIVFSHTDATGYTMTVEGPNVPGTPGNVFVSQSATCNYPNPSLPLNTTYCLTDPSFTLMGTEPNGANTSLTPYSGTGVTGSTFDPAAAGVGGPYPIQYNYDPSGNGNNQCLQPVISNTSVINCTVCEPDNGTPAIGN